MNRSMIPAIYLADRLVGDPEWFPHPVRFMGRVIQEGEKFLRRPGESEERALLSGAALTIGVVIASYCLTRLTIAQANRCSKALGRLTEIALGWTCLAARNLEDEASRVLTALDAHDMELARRRLGRIVGRDTQHLDSHEISRAVIETVAESASDGVIAPLFYMSLGGVPLAMAYKAVNTLDSMIGHADDRYFYFGKIAARLDDAANYLPARLTSLTIVAGAWLFNDDPHSAWRIWRRDGNKHKSPNAGQPESAMAGALKVRLGGGNAYDGEFLPAESMGQEFPAPRPEDARKAIRIVSAAALLGAGIGMLLSVLRQPGRNR